MTGRRQDAVVDGRPVTATVAEAGLHIDGLDPADRMLAWLDVDDLDDADHRITLVMADGMRLTLTRTGATHDRFVDEIRAARRAVRLPAAAMATGAPDATFTSRHPTAPADIHLFAKAVVIEPRSGHPTCVPLSLIEAVRRDGHTILLDCRGITDTSITMLGARTDEFCDRLGRARTALRVATMAAYEAFDPRLAGCAVPDGWSITRADDTAVWTAMHSAATTGERSLEVTELSGLADARLRYGLFTDGGEHPLPFLLAPVGDLVVVESVGDDDRATFVFRTDDVERLNAALIAVAFRREVLSQPVDELGRWAVAARTSPTVVWARAACVARVVHGPQWSTALHRVLATD